MRANMKQNSFEKLVNNLSEMTKQYRLLLDCVRQETELLIHTDIEKLNESNANKEKILTEIKQLEVLRINYATELAQLLGTDTQSPRLLEMAQKMGGYQGDELKAMHSILELLTNRLMQVNKENAIYAEAALNTVGMAMNNIKESLMGQKTYQKKGSYQQGHDKSGHLVSREA